MRAKILELLKSYAGGKFRNSLIYETPEVITLVTDANIDSVSESEIRSLVRAIKNNFNIDITVMDADQHRIQSMLISISTLFKERVSTELIDPVLRLITKRNVSFTATISPEESEKGAELKSIAEQIARNVCDSVGFSLSDIDIQIAGPPVFTNARLLKLIVTHAPLTFDSIQAMLRQEGTFRDDDIKILKSRLDKLRHKGKILRQKEDGTYVPTRAALYTFSKKQSRYSSDIERALELARRQW